MTLLNDYARCAGAGWEECHDCQRRTSGGGEKHIAPPQIVTLWCEYYIEPDTNSIHGSTNGYHS